MDDISIILFSSECSGGYLWIIHLRSATMVQWVVGFHPRQYLVCPLWIKRNRNILIYSVFGEKHIQTFNSKGHTEGSIISGEFTPRLYFLLFELAFLHYEKSIYFNFQINITNSIFHLTFEVAQKLNVVYCLYFSEEFWMWCLIHNIWKENIILQRTKFKSLPQDDDAKDDVASEYWPLNLWSAPIYKWPVMTALTVG